MSKRAIVLIALACLVVGVVAGMVLLRPSLEKIDIDRNGPPAPEESVPQAMTRTFTEENESHRVNVEYPELQGISAPGVREKINGHIKTGVYNQIAGFRSANSEIQPPLDDPNLRSYFEGGFDVAMLNRSFFSALMTYSDYSAGAAHPNGYNIALNYNLKTGEALGLDQVLRGLNPSAGYMERLARYAKEELRRQFGDSEDAVAAIEIGAAPAAENYANFTLSTKGLTVHFDPYQVAPYAAGSPTVEVPHADLMGKIIKPAAGNDPPTSTAKWWLQ